MTYGYASSGVSIADFIAKSHSNTVSYKYAVSGTTLSNLSTNSYVARMKEIDTSLDFDMFIVQLI